MSKVVHFEIAADDPEKLARFYTDSFGWKIEEWKQPGVIDEAHRYWMIKAGPKEEMGIGGGMYKRQKPLVKGGPNAYVCSVYVEDIEKAAKTIEKNGGKVEEIMDIKSVGRSAAAQDPEGNMFGIFWADPKGTMQEM